MLSPRIQAVEDMVANGSQHFLDIERERVCHCKLQLHQYERQRRERDATLRRLRDESQSLKAAAGTMVPTAVARLLELELLLDQAYHRHHAQTLTKHQAAGRIKALRAKLPLREQRVAHKRQELVMVSREIEKRGQVLAASSNQAQQAHRSLVELQERVVRQRAARQQELAALRAFLGVDILARDIQSLEQQLRELSAEAPTDTTHRQQEKIREQLAQLNEQMLRKTLKRTTEFDQKTGAIVPPHQTHFDPRWAHGSPVGKTERLRCLSAGPSPNRPPTAGTLRQYKQVFANAMHCEAVLATSLLGQRDEAHELPTGERQLHIVKQQLLHMKTQLLATSQRLSSLTALFAAVGPRLEQLMLACSSAVSTEVQDKRRDVDGDDDKASLLSMVEQHVSCVLAALESAGSRGRSCCVAGADVGIKTGSSESLGLAA